MQPLTPATLPTHTHTHAHTGSLLAFGTQVTVPMLVKELKAQPLSHRCSGYPVGLLPTLGRQDAASGDPRQRHTQYPQALGKKKGKKQGLMENLSKEAWSYEPGHKPCHAPAACNV